MLRSIVWVVVIIFLAAGCAKKEEAQTSMEFPEIMNAEVSTQTNLVLMGSAKQAAGAASPAVSGSAPMPSPQEVATSVDNPTNEDIQKALKNANLYMGKIDGEIGPKTKKAIRTFQEQNGLKADGKVGSKTWAKL